MSTVSPQTSIMVFDSVAALQSLRDDLDNLPIDPPSLYIDLEGRLLGRHGSVSVVLLYVVPTGRTYLVDIYCLGSTVFSTINSTTTSLKTILESPAIPKVFFDIRNDSDTLFSHYQILVNNIKEHASQLYDHNKGGRYEVFNERPDCARDVALLPGLYGVYNAKLRLPVQAFWRVQVRDATKDRIKLS